MAEPQDDVIVSIEGVGDVSFPASMTPEEMSAAAKKLHEDHKTAGTKAYELATNPLIPQIASAAHTIADYTDAPQVDRGVWEARARGLMAGVTGASGDVLSAMTSPVNLAMMLAGLGPESKAAESIPALKELLALKPVQVLQGAVSAGGSGAAAVQGTAQMLAPGNTPEERLLGLAQAAGGAAGLANNPDVVRGVKATSRGVGQGMVEASKRPGYIRGGALGVMGAGTVSGYPLASVGTGAAMMALPPVMQKTGNALLRFGQTDPSYMARTNATGARTLDANVKPQPIKVQARPAPTVESSQIPYDTGHPVSEVATPGVDPAVEAYLKAHPGAKVQGPATKGALRPTENPPVTVTPPLPSPATVASLNQAGGGVRLAAKPPFDAQIATSGAGNFGHILPAEQGNFPHELAPPPIPESAYSKVTPVGPRDIPLVNEPFSGGTGPANMPRGASVDRPTPITPAEIAKTSTSPVGTGASRTSAARPDLSADVMADVRARQQSAIASTPAAEPEIAPIDAAAMYRELKRKDILSPGEEQTLRVLEKKLGIPANVGEASGVGSSYAARGKAQSAIFPSEE